MLIQTRHPYTENLNSETSEDSKNAFLDCGGVLGTYGYMAPEQFRGAAQPASDLYALGGTLLYLLSGVLPLPPYIHLRTRFIAMPPRLYLCTRFPAMPPCIHLCTHLLPCLPSTLESVLLHERCC